VLRPHPSVNHDASLLQQTAHQFGGKFGRVLNGQRLGCPGIAQRYRAPDGELIRAGLAIDQQLTRFAAGRRRGYAVLNAVIVGEGRNADVGALAYVIGRYR
jgi:hypothetical protein